MVGGSGETGVGRLQDLTGTDQPVEERSPATGPLPPVEPLLGGKGLGSFGQALGSQQLATDRSGDQILPSVGSAGQEASSDAERLE